MRSGILAIVACAVAVTTAGCGTNRVRVPEVSPPPGHQKVVPTAYAMVGRLYREGAGERPWLITSNGDIFSEICWNDFIETAALRELDAQHVVPTANVIHPRAVSSLSIGGSLSGGGILSGLPVQVGASAAPQSSYELNDLRLVVLTETGQEIIRDNLGPNCQELKRSHRAAGRDILLLVEGLRADSGRQTAGLKLDLKPQVGPVAAGVVTDQSSEIETSRMLISARMRNF